MREKTLVLGGGISALAYLYYNPTAFAMVGPEPGGQFARTARLGPQYLWVTPSTTKLIRDMGITPVTRRVIVGYVADGKVVKPEEVTLAHRVSYSMKTRGTEPKSSHMSDGVSEFQVWDVKLDELVATLEYEVRSRLIMETAEEIDLYCGRVRDRAGWLPYDKLVSTIPAPVFLNLCGSKHLLPHLRAHDKFYVADRMTPKEEELFAAGFDYAYFPGSEPYHRVAIKNSMTREVVREYTMIPGRQVDTEEKRGFMHKAGQIIGGGEHLEQFNPMGVEFLGRYAEWNHDVRLEDVLEAVQ